METENIVIKKNWNGTLSFKMMNPLSVGLYGNLDRGRAKIIIFVGSNLFHNCTGKKLISDSSSSKFTSTVKSPT